ncbi:hypothetical protein [Pectinatus sottacetonis]|uniref:hypothetical protein n=1 Tax=Pectinatus sottacetonis TaxID=1002795 RepID=UPI0018C6799C|nr:hypothetical protein [Pectinatus sottacetonis]
MFHVPDHVDYNGNNPHLKTEKLTSIVFRKPELKEEFSKLQNLIDSGEFTKYVEPIRNITRNESTLLITAGSELQRMHIEDIIPEIKEAFSIERVKVIGIMKTMF